MKTSYSRHELYALGEPLGDSATRKEGNRVIYGGGGGGAPTQTSSTVTQTNLPTYAQPYVESMLGATQQQLFTGPGGAPLTKNAEGYYDIGGFQPYKAYGGTYDASGKQISYDPSKGIAGFQPMQETAQQGIQDMKLPGQYDTAANTTQNAMDRAMGMQYNPAAINVQQVAAPNLQNYQMGPAKEVSAQQVGVPTMDAAQTNYNPNIQAFQMGPAERISAQQVGTPLMDTAQTAYRPDLQTFQMGPAEQVRTQSFANPYSASAYMSPYMQNVVDIQKREAQRQSGIQGAQQQAQAAQAGAFGGGRDAILRAERERNLSQQMGDIQAQGSQAAFQQAQQQFNAEQQARLAAQQANQQAGLQVGGQNLQAALGVQQLGTQTGLQTSLANLSSAQQANVQNQAAQLQAQGLNAQQAMQAALANQQAGLQVGQQNLAAQQAAQQLGTQTGLQTALANLSNRQQAAVQNQAAQLQAQGMNSQQALQAALANQQAGLTVGGQNLNALLGIQQLGAGQNLQAQLANQQALAQAQQLQAQQQQFGANYGLQGLQTGLQGANQLAALGGQKLQAQQGIYGLQNQYGAQQQALEQQKLNQAMQDYANAQQYPLMQLGTMSNMLRGLPMQASTSQMYQAQPNLLTQGIGAAGSLASLYNAYNKPGGAAGGLPSEFKYAKGGIAAIPRYDVGGQVASQLQQMDDKALENEAKTSPSPKIREMAQAILKQRQAGMDTSSQMQQGVGPMNVDYNANYAGGGIIAFANRGEVDEAEAARLANQTQMYIQGAQQAAAERQAQEAAMPAVNDRTPRDPSIYRADVPYAENENLPLSQRIANTLNRIRSRTDPTFVSPSAAAPNDTAAALNENEFAPSGITAAPVDDRVKRTPSLYNVATASAARPTDDRTKRTASLYGPATAPKAGPAAAPNSIMAAAPKAPPALLDRNAPAYSGPADTAALPASQVDPFAATKEALAKAQAEADKTTKQIYDENLAAKKALGLDQNEAQQEYMKSVMAQKANIAADAEQRKYLRMAEFFASWGSTPGDTLVAGMSALKAKIPDMIADVKEQRKAMADADKVLYELGQAKRQEDLGNWDKAESKKIKASELAAKLQENLTTATASYEGHKLTAAATVKGHEISAEASKYHADKVAEAQKYAANMQDKAREEAAKGRLTGMQTSALLHAAENLAALPAKLERGRAGNKEYEAAIRDESMLKAQLTQDPTNKELMTELGKAQDKLSGYRKSDADTIARAQAQVDALAKKAFGPEFTAFSASTTAPTSTMSPVDKQALEWANKNPNDPRSTAIKQRLGQ